MSGVDIARIRPIPKPDQSKPLVHRESAPHALDIRITPPLLMLLDLQLMARKVRMLKGHSLAWGVIEIFLEVSEVVG